MSGKSINLGWHKRLRVDTLEEYSRLWGPRATRRILKIGLGVKRLKSRDRRRGAKKVVKGRKP